MLFFHLQCTVLCQGMKYYLFRGTNCPVHPSNYKKMENYVMKNFVMYFEQLKKLCSFLDISQHSFKFFNSDELLISCSIKHRLSLFLYFFNLKIVWIFSFIFLKLFVRKFVQTDSIKLKLYEDHKVL